MSDRPYKLVTLSGFAIFLGAVTFLFVVSQITGLNQTNYVQKSFPKEHQKAIKAQRQMMKEYVRVSKGWNVYLIANLIAVLVASLALVAGGIFSLSMRPIGPQLLKISIFFLIPLETVRTAYGVFVSSKVMPQYMSNLAEMNSNDGSKVPAILPGIAHFAMYFAIGITLLFLVGKMIYYILSIHYFRKPEIIGLYYKKIPKPPPLKRDRLTKQAQEEDFRPLT